MNCFLKTKMMIILLCVFVLLGLMSCNSLPDTLGTEVLHIENQKIESLVRKHEQASYTLVFENGSRNCIQRWETLFKQLPDNVNIFAYNRPGYCKSSSAKSMRTSDNIVNELRHTLQQQEVKPPYILIGHSLGGLYMQHFARQYPNEVKGLVLVDAVYPGLLKKPEEFPWYAKLGMTTFMSGDMKEELYLAHTSGATIDSLPAIDHMPIVRLFNYPKRAIEDGTAVSVDMGMVNKDETLIEKIKAMYPRAKTVVADSSHQMQETSPELVVQAIQDVMQAKEPLQ
ncbi:alpha/beta fold hydrolase [Cellvibrio sp. pealriver]|uniref:alpha/beta fold hydrolase n=1 Tax=Cellvibrio sp. pealriver TaxID=1622269 RepID=UPI00066FBE13|nr:alpha/beta hydrolase [Cellvibrio sp. pealriver]